MASVIVELVPVGPTLYVPGSIQIVVFGYCGEVKDPVPTM